MDAHVLTSGMAPADLAPTISHRSAKLEIWPFSNHRYLLSLDPRIRTAVECAFTQKHALTDQTRPMGHGRCQENTIRSRILLYMRILGKPIVHLLEKRLKELVSPFL